MSLLLASRRLRATAASLLLGAATSTFALDTATISSRRRCPRLPRIPRGRHLLLAVLHAIRLLGSHLRQVRHYVPMRWCRATRTPENPWLKSGR